MHREGEAPIRRVVAAVLLLLTVGCGVDAGAGPPGDVRYGAPGPVATGPEFCPPPWNAIEDRNWYPKAERAWEELGGGPCYGSDGPYRVCGDGYLDQGDHGDCAGAEAQEGLPYALSDEQRWARPNQVIGGECFDALDGDRIRLVDCRLAVTGRVVWGDATRRPGSELQAICDLNDGSFPGLDRTHLAEVAGVYACYVTA